MLEVTQVVKVVSVGTVKMTGTLDYHSTDDPDDYGSWKVLSGIHSKVDIEEWFEKFKGKYVTITIHAHERDESKLLNGAPTEEDQ